jgi:hypothetical protein
MKVTFKKPTLQFYIGSIKISGVGSSHSVKTLKSVTERIRMRIGYHEAECSSSSCVFSFPIASYYDELRIELVGTSKYAPDLFLGSRNVPLDFLEYVGSDAEQKMELELNNGSGQPNGSKLTFSLSYRQL